jgi:hypothetical protein
MVSRIASLIYVVIGAVVASQHHFFTNINSVDRAISAVLGIGLWPAVLLGLNLHIH